MRMIPSRSEPAVSEPRLRYGTAPARWVLATTVLGSGIVFLDGTVVQVALPAIGSDLGGSFADLQWTINGYLVTLSALILLGGSLGDRFGRRRIFTAGLAAFVVASLKIRSLGGRERWPGSVRAGYRDTDRRQQGSSESLIADVPDVRRAGRI